MIGAGKFRFGIANRTVGTERPLIIAIQDAIFGLSNGFVERIWAVDAPKPFIGQNRPNTGGGQSIIESQLFLRPPSFKCNKNCAIPISARRKSHIAPPPEQSSFKAKQASLKSGSLGLRPNTVV